MRRSGPCSPCYLNSASSRDLGQHDWFGEATRGTHPRVEQSHSSGCVRHTVNVESTSCSGRSSDQSHSSQRRTVPGVCEERFLGCQDVSTVRKMRKVYLWHVNFLPKLHDVAPVITASFFAIPRLPKFNRELHHTAKQSTRSFFYLFSSRLRFQTKRVRESCFWYHNRIRRIPSCGAHIRAVTQSADGANSTLDEAVNQRVIL